MLLKERKRNFSILFEEVSKWADSRGERVIVNCRNRISLAVTLKGIGSAKAKDFGAFLYRKGVMGARVVVQSLPVKAKSEEKKMDIKDVKYTEVKVFSDNLYFKNFGGHTEDEDYRGFPYITFAAAIGSKEKEIYELIKRLDSVYMKQKK